jgi:hypothetical protein
MTTVTFILLVSLLVLIHLIYIKLKKLVTTLNLKSSEDYQNLIKIDIMASTFTQKIVIDTINQLILFIY